MDKLSPAIRKFIEKEYGSGIDPEYFIEILYSFPENEWLRPFERKVANSSHVLRTLTDGHLIAFRKVPIWEDDGTFTGTVHEYFYRKNLNYKNLV